MMKNATATRSRSRSRNGHSSSKPEMGQMVQTALSAIGAPLLMKLALRKSVLIAIGLGTVASWVVGRMLKPKPRPKRFGLF